MIARIRIALARWLLRGTGAHVAQNPPKGAKHARATTGSSVP